MRFSLGCYVWSVAYLHRYGGRDLARQEHAWPGVGVARVRWRADDGTTGSTCRREHQVFVTLAGSTGRTRASIDGGERYDGVDFPGAVTFIPGSRHRRASYRGGTIEYVAIRLDPDRLDDRDAELVGFTNRPDPLVHRLALALSDEARSATVASGLFVDSVANTLMLHLLRTASSSAPGRPVPLGGKAVRRVVEYVEDHLADDLRLAVLAEVAGVDRYRFSRGFKAATGASPHAYVIQRRLDRAARLLRSADGPSVAEVAYRVGLSSQSHLTTLFRRSFGTTPGAFRSSRGPGLG